MLRFVVYVTVIAAGLAMSVAAPAAQYTITALEPLPGGLDSRATAINERGQVVGHSTLDRTGHVGRSRPVIWDSSGRPHELWSDPVFGGIPLGINNHGQIVGRYGSGSGIPLPGPGIPPGGAFIWDPTTRNFMDLGDLGGRNVQATGINDRGQVSGSSENALGQPRAFLWEQANGMRDLGTLGGIWSFGNDINGGGEIAGYAWRGDDSEHGFLWKPSSGMHDIGFPARNESRAIAINNLGEVVGINWGSPTTPGGMFIATTTERTVVAVPSGTSLIPFDINDHGDIVGYMGAPGDSRLHGFIWNARRGLTRLDSLIAPNSGWHVEQTTSINDVGQIVGYGLLNEQVRGFILTPIPEPSSSVLGAGAAFCTVLIARLYVRKRR